MADLPACRDQDGATGSPPPSFDTETAFKVLRSAGYYMHALWVAEQAKQPEWVLDVLLEDMKSYEDAINFIGNAACTAACYAVGWLRY